MLGIMLVLLPQCSPAPGGVVGGATYRLASDYIRVGVTVGDARAGRHSYVSELQLNQDHFAGSLGFGWSPNLVVNFSQPGYSYAPGQNRTDRSRLSGTALVSWNGSASAWHAPLGGSATTTATATGGTVHVGGIELGSAGSEEWTLALDGAQLSWTVKRTLAHAVNATCDRMPALIFNAEYTETGHVLKSSAQIPSFVDPGLEWDPASGRGFLCNIAGQPVTQTPDGSPAAPSGYWAEGVSSKCNQTIMLSPSMLALTSVGSRRDVDGAAPLKFAISLPPSSATLPSGNLGLGYTTIRPTLVPHSEQHTSKGWWGMFIIVDRGAQFYVPPENKTKYHILPTDCGTLCRIGMPAACAGPVAVSASAAAALADGGNFSCDKVPMPPPAVLPNTTALRAGQTVEVGWTMSLGQGAGVAPLTVSTGNTGLDQDMKTLSAVFNMWSGNVFGNSPASVVCLHEMSWFPMAMSVMDAPSKGADSVHAALKAQLRMFARHAQQDSGFIFPRWDGHNWENGCIHDQMPHFVLACEYDAYLSGSSFCGLSSFASSSD
jgi:hypothetical protein